MGGWMDGLIAYSMGRFHAGFMRGSCAGHKNCHVSGSLEHMEIVNIHFISTMISIGFNGCPWISIDFVSVSLSSDVVCSLLHWFRILLSIVQGCRTISTPFRDVSRVSKVSQ